MYVILLSRENVFQGFERAVQEMKKKSVNFPLSVKDTLTSILIMGLAFLLCVPLQNIGGSDFHVPLIFVLAVLLISRFTSGYFYGIAASVLSVFCVNYVFTYPYFALNFTISGYPLTFISMLAVSIITSALTSQIMQQEKIRMEIEKEKMRANLLRAISHDLRTPLTSIVGSTTAVIENADFLSEERRNELLSEACQEAQWLIRMVENLLSITRIGDSAAEIKKELEAVEEIIGEAVGKFRKQFPDMKISVSIPDEILFIPMDAMLIEQVLMNLFYNSEAHGKHTTEITLTVTSENDLALFSVRDNGAGFSEESLQHVFEGFYPQTSKNKNADHQRNMGIGLSVCMSIVKAHGGKMFAENGADGGAVINFSLPLKEE